MGAEATFILSDRQVQVLELIDKRMSVKEIARELDLSMGRVNQLIRNLKTRFNVDTLGELAAVYRRSHFGTPAPYTKDQCSKSKLPDDSVFGDFMPRDATDSYVFSDAMPLNRMAPWQNLQAGEGIVPEVLDGANGTLVRGFWMVVIAVGVLLAMLVCLLAMTTLSELF